MKDVFGSPHAKDVVAEDDSLVEELAREQASLMDELIKERPRKVGSKPVPKAEREMEWQASRLIKGALTQFFVDQEATVEEMIDYATEMEKK